MEKEILPIEVAEEEGKMTSVMKMVRDQQGNTYLIYMTYPPYDENTYSTQEYTYYISKYDSNFIELYTKDISEVMMEDDENRYVQNACIDEKGYLYLSAENCIRILNDNGEYQGKIETDGDWIQAMGTSKEGKVYISRYSRN